MHEIILYETGSGRSPVQEYINKLNNEHKYNEIAQIDLYKERLKNYGMLVNDYHPLTIKPLRDGVYELRPGGNRILFFHYTGSQFVLLHAFAKKTRKTPPHEIEKAIKEMKDYKRRNK